MYGITIGPAAGEDMARAAAIEKEAFSQPWSEEALRDTLAFPNVIFAVAKMQEEPVGYCIMYCALDEGEITNVAVKKACRGKGIGKKLMEFLLEEARHTGIHRLILEVRVSNAPAIGLYEEMGFEIQGVRPGFYQCPKEDGYVMVRSQ